MLARVKRYAKQRYKAIMTEIIADYHLKTDTTDTKMLDAGAGSCWLLHSLTLKCVKVGIDISPHHQLDDYTFLTFLAEDSAYFVFGDATRMPFPNCTFDCVFSNEFVSHVYNIDKALAEQVRVLKKGGIMIIMDANASNPANFIANFLVDYVRSRGKMGGLRWLFHRDEPYRIRVPTKQGFREVSYKSENTHSRRWWAKKLETYSTETKFEVSTVCSFVSLSSYPLLAGEIWGL